jgi:hypothetical protein
MVLRSISSCYCQSNPVPGSSLACRWGTASLFLPQESRLCISCWFSAWRTSCFGGNKSSMTDALMVRDRLQSVVGTTQIGVLSMSKEKLLNGQTASSRFAASKQTGAIRSMNLAERFDVTDYVSASTAAALLEKRCPGLKRNWYEFLKRNRAGQTREEFISFSRVDGVVRYRVGDLYAYLVSRPTSAADATVRRGCSTRTSGGSGRVKRYVIRCTRHIRGVLGLSDPNRVAAGSGTSKR